MKSLKNLFKSEDFDGTGHCSKTCAEIAQKILDQFIKENGVKVTGYKGSLGFMWGSYGFHRDTHSAILLDIQPLKQCEHKEAVYVEDQDKTWFKCRDCGKPVKAKGWEAV